MAALEPVGTRRRISAALPSCPQSCPQLRGELGEQLRRIWLVVFGSRGDGLAPARRAAWSAVGEDDAVAAMGLDDAVAELLLIEARVEPASSHELVVSAMLDDPAAIDREDHVGVANGREPVGDRDRGAALHQRLQGMLYDAL